MFYWCILLFDSDLCHFLPDFFHHDAKMGCGLVTLILAKAKVDSVNILCDLAEKRPVLGIVSSGLNNCGWIVLQDLLGLKAAQML